MSAEGVVLQLAGLLKAGIHSELARKELEHDLEQLSHRQRAQFEAIWKLAIGSGGAVSGSIESLGEIFRAASRQQRNTELAFAGPKATAKLVAWLPIAGLLLAQLFGLEPVRAILTNPLAFGAVAFGAVLLLVGHLWSRAIIRKAAPNEEDPGLFFDAVRFGMEAGMPLTPSIEQATEVFQQELNLLPSKDVVSRLARIGEWNRSSGASISNLLAGEATARREALWFAESQTLSKLSVKLMLPLGLVTLPAFVLSSIVPVAISLLSSRQNL